MVAAFDFGMDSDDDEDDEDSDDSGEDKEQSFDEEEFSRAMREMMGLPQSTMLGWDKVLWRIGSKIAKESKKSNLQKTREILRK